MEHSRRSCATSITGAGGAPVATRGIPSWIRHPSFHWHCEWLRRAGTSAPTLGEIFFTFHALLHCVSEFVGPRSLLSSNTVFSPAYLLLDVRDSSTLVLVLPKSRQVLANRTRSAARALCKSHQMLVPYRDHWSWSCAGHSRRSRSCTTSPQGRLRANLHMLCNSSEDA